MAMTPFELEGDRPNIMPSRYRQVALSAELDGLDPDHLTAYFIGREAYVRTRFVVARHRNAVALIEVGRPASERLFSPITHLRVLAAAPECRYVVDDTVDCAVPSHVAAVAARHPDARCVVVEGRYAHISFILNPHPVRLRVLDIVPPFPSKLLDQVRRVLDVAEDLVPVIPVEDLRDSRQLFEASATAASADVLMPCRGSGVQIAGASVAYLDERPAHREWTLLGCARSQQIHEWFYGRQAPIVDTCPRQFLQLSDPDGSSAISNGNLAGSANGNVGCPTLTRCCLLQQGIERHGSTVIVPWGASLGEVRTAIDVVVQSVGAAWTPT
jgi:hypothetical protein